MSLLSLIGKGVKNADWEKIGSGMIDFMQKAGVAYGNYYRTEEIEAFIRLLLYPRLDAKALLLNEDIFKGNWAQVFKTGNPTKWQEVMKTRDAVWTESPQICANEPTDFYPADNPLKATKWCPEN